MTTSLPELDELAARVHAAERAAQDDPSRRLVWIDALLDLAEGLRRCGRADQAIAAVDEAVALLGTTQAHLRHAGALDVRASLLRSLGRSEEALESAERALELVAGLASRDPAAHLLPLAQLTHNLGRCYRQAQRFDRAAAAFEQAVGGYRILAQAHSEAHGGALVEVMSDHALALAQVGELERAHALASATLELAERSPGWGLLPLITGIRQLLADLALDLGRPREALEHLLAGMRLLDAAIAERLPGATGAAAKLAASLRELCEAQGFSMPEELAAKLGSCR
ncbi:MAG: tetratricopeptide repeat protein [Enhygromyxa sp.]